MQLLQRDKFLVYLLAVWSACAVMAVAVTGCASNEGSPDLRTLHLPATTDRTLATSTPTPDERTATQRKIAALLFDIALADIDQPNIGANYDYNHFGEDPEPENTCNGYAGGHAGTDVQTDRKSVV